MAADDNLETLLEWCADNSIHIDDRIHIIHGDAKTRHGVFAKDDFIPGNTTLVKIPKSAVLSTKSSSVAHLLPQHHFGLGAQLSLSLALYAEILKGRQSRFYCYLQSLPSGIVDLPVFWSVNQNWERTFTPARTFGDGLAALKWLSGTDAGDLLWRKTENGMTLLDEITSFYRNEALPLINGLIARQEGAIPTPDILGFYRAFSLVSSRAFLVDAFHGLSMVPVADAFNHVIENSIHLESDYDVCPECGSLEECPHDLEATAPMRKTNSPGDGYSTLAGADQHLDMVSNLAVPPGAEIFNTYGEHLSNAQLLNQYGFILDVNHNDRLTWSLQDILGTLGLPDIGADSGDDSNIGGLLGNIHAVYSALSEVPASSLSQLVFFDNQDQCATDNLVYCLNDEGSLSRELWSLLFLLSLRHHRKTNSYSGTRTPTSVATLVWELQIWAEDNGYSDEDDEEDEIHEIDAEMDYDIDEEESHTTRQIQKGSRNPVPESLRDPLAQSILYQVSGWATHLCRARKRRIGIPGAWEMDLSDVMENLPEDYVRTRMAVTVVMTERSILECCEASWRSLQFTISQGIVTVQG